MLAVNDRSGNATTPGAGPGNPSDVARDDRPGPRGPTDDSAQPAAATRRRSPRRPASAAISRPSSARHEGHPVAYFDGPGGTQVPARRRRGDGRLPDVAQRQHPLGLPDQRRDGLRPGPLAAGPGGLPQRLARRGRLRREHDDADLPPRPGAGPDRWDRATRSSSPSSTITPTSTPGGRSTASAASRCAR